MTVTSVISTGTRRWAAAVGLATLVVLAGAACVPESPASDASAQPSTEPSASATPTAQPPLSATAMDGFWRATPEGSSFAVRGDLIMYESGQRARVLAGEGDFVSTIAEGATSCDEGTTGSCAPLGQLVPAGTTVEIPDYAQGVTDDVSLDRIWDGQAGVLYMREPLTTAADFPAELQGSWCSDDGDVCFGADDLLAEYPLAFVNSTSAAEYVPGAKDFALCVARDMGEDGCTTAASMFLRYFPKGTEWDCDQWGKEGRLPFGFTSCLADTVVAHDVAKERLIIVPNHQQAQEYVDSVPLYRK